MGPKALEPPAGLGGSEMLYRGGGQKMASRGGRPVIYPPHAHLWYICVKYVFNMVELAPDLRDWQSLSRPGQRLSPV